MIIKLNFVKLVDKVSVLQEEMMDMIEGKSMGINDCKIKFTYFCINFISNG